MTRNPDRDIPLAPPRKRVVSTMPDTSGDEPCGCVTNCLKAEGMPVRGRCATEWYTTTPGERCPHGAIRNMQPPRGVVWMEVVETCDCCGSIYWFNFPRVPRNCCIQCGAREETREEIEARNPAPMPEPPLKTLQERLAEFKARRQLVFPIGSSRP